MRIFLFSLFSLGLAGPALPATIHVPGDQPTIQAGIDAAQMDDTVLVACGSYLVHELVMKSGVVLRSENGEPGCVTLDAGGHGRALSCNGVNALAVIEGFRFIGGFVEGSMDSRGGAILLMNSYPTIRRCIFDQNEASAGGGGIYVLLSDPVIEDCVFSRNSGVDGGGLYLNRASPVVSGCVFSDNDCLVWGGAVFCENGSHPTLQNCTLVRNDAYQGAGFYCVWECQAILENCLIAFSTGGEGVYTYQNHGHQSVIAVTCCDVFGNAIANYGGVIQDQTGLNGNISSDPLFCAGQEDDFSLSHPSPCLPGQNECGVQIGALGEGCDLNGVPALDAGSVRTGLVGGVPNPFGVSTQVNFRLPAPSAVTLRIFDLQGREVRRLAEERAFPAGASAVFWDGRDGAGRALASGIYLCRFESGLSTETGRISLVR